MQFYQTLALCAVFVSTAWSFPNKNPRVHDKHPPSPTATVDSGVITGRTTNVPSPASKGAQVNQFLGIPFALPPVKDLRFSPPRKPKPWSEPKATTEKPPACIQNFGNKTSGSDFIEAIFNTPPPPGESEDCLYLNVYAPKGTESKHAGKPVLFWIYGGAYKYGSSSRPFDDGTSMAANQDIIVVSINYRTNLFGFPRSPQLPLGEQNLGELDQRLALDWVKRNIHAFGGDPQKVTIAGESAGAVAVGSLINTMPDDPPFRGAILQSGSSVIKLPPGPPNNDTTSWTALIERLKCPDTSDKGIMACARAASVETLQEIMSSTGLSFNEPIRDNVTTLESPLPAYATHKVAKVPILIGSTYDDGSVFTVGASDNVTEYLTGLSLPPKAVEAIAKLYAPGSPATKGLATGKEIITQIVTDSAFRCPAGFISHLTKAALHVPVWQYMFNSTLAKHPQFPDLGVYHSSEIQFAFGTGQAEEANALWMQKLWANFVKDPHHGPGWKPYPAVGVLGAKANQPVTTEDVNVLNPICAEWNKVYALLLTAKM